jgi:hypothetical protein
MRSECICSLSVILSVSLSVRAKLREGYRVKECFPEGTVIFLSAIFERTLRLFANSYLHRKLWKFLRNNLVYESVDL